MKLVIASNNIKKRQEIMSILKLLNIDFLSAEETTFVDVVEDGDTFAANARKKAEAFAKANQFAALADDSGLSVPALGNEPGVYSARYAGEQASDLENYTKLLKNMHDQDNRYAYFSCALHLSFPKEEQCITAEAISEGQILTAAQGQEGFGYDPIFFSKDLQKCFALCSAQEKASISHRGRALRLLLDKIPKHSFTL
ncbi:MAG: RdgB/HAM1 family non-canonical purine NTP pyrophosphatase [Mariprofundaceae bacterium]|nr:RdgB/HAM1 family non-canonical purine NTP pyrophosphatase [Mariprofundaceae bacterium]